MENWSKKDEFKGKLKQTRLVKWSTGSLIEDWSKHGQFNGVLDTGSLMENWSKQGQFNGALVV